MILNVFSLGGKVAVMTGCDAGLSQGMALGPAEAGYDIVGINIVEPTKTIERMTALGRRFLSLTAGLRRINGVPALLKRAVAEFGHIDILVDDAGPIRRDDAIDFSKRDWDDVMNPNIKSVFFVSQTTAKYFIAQGNDGRIINIASILSFQGRVHVSSYIASKSDVMGVTHLMANEWIKHNISINVVTPGYIATNNTQQLRADERRSTETPDRIPAGRWGLPNDLMGPVVFLASSISDCINGYAVAIDDGWLTRQLTFQNR